MATQTFYCPTKIHIGPGSHAAIIDELTRIGSERLFVAVDRAVIDSPIMRTVRSLLDAGGVAYVSFSEIEPDPSDVTVEKAFALASMHGASTILAVGGGSTIDVAKAVGILATNGGRIHDYEGIEKYAIPPLPLIALPTTAGTGSEVSGSCVITDTTRRLKMSIRHAAMNPARVAILDPGALVTMPPHVAMHAGVDAFVHAFESFIARGANPITDALNLHAIELIAGNIRAFVADRSNLAAGEAMLVGSALAGMAFGLTGLGNVHCLARFVGAFFHLSHGLSNAICLSRVAAFNRPAAMARYARLAAILAPTSGGDDAALSEATVAAISRLCADLGVPESLRDVGADPARFDEMADLCVAAGYNRWNPRETTRDDFRRLLDELY
ncbi:MAG: iron-containing alcohol dehydrogenase [Bosea sp.]|uniref:iron-containing alcohol dehydrogenase n=1 Tax=Bosea sp. (in: a-proteobacteria) TaxID=1871050 RepID=UPI0010F74059|nr:iron-containing alcohol dehydrogenase [Bosea sp. (in: a-proteobacteria)]MCP4734837.1 iron-containing alcohol dehydrogenase [Bosea sp. (in: a-proteobacteria)]